MREIEVLLTLAQRHDDAATMELASRFARKMMRECNHYGHGMDEDMQSFLLLQFIEEVYFYDPNRGSKGLKGKISKK